MRQKRRAGDVHSVTWNVAGMVVPTAVTGLCLSSQKCSLPALTRAAPAGNAGNQTRVNSGSVAHCRTGGCRSAARRFRVDRRPVTAGYVFIATSAVVNQPCCQMAFMFV